MRQIAALFLLAFPLTASAQKVALPAEVQGAPCAFVIIEAKTDCASLKWVPMDAGLSLIPPDLLKDSRSAVVMAGAPGRYRVLAYGAKGDQVSDPAICTVVIGGAPAPVPVPPEPVPPVPVPPADPLFKVLQPLYAADTTPEKAKRCGQLAEGYQKSALTAMDSSLKTAGDLATKCKAHFQVLPYDALPKVRDAIGAELDQHLPRKTDAVLDAVTRKTAEAQFTRMANLLRALP